MTDDNNSDGQRIRRLCERFLGTVRHSLELGMTLEDASPEGVLVRLRYSDRIVGNPWSGIAHGGPILALLDQTGGLAVVCALYPDLDITPTLDLRIDHLRKPEPFADILAWASCHRVASNVAFVRGCAYQESREHPCSMFVATFMRLGLERGILTKGKTP